MKLLAEGMMTNAAMPNVFCIKTSGGAWKSLCLSWHMWSPLSNICGSYMWSGYLFSGAQQHKAATDCFLEAESEAGTSDVNATYEHP